MKSKEKEIKSLQKEIQRKEKALAETAAILVLRKKLGALLGTEDEEE
jgi:transposase